MAQSFNVIGIDEGQFVSTCLPTPPSHSLSHTYLSLQFPDVVEFCEEMASSGKMVIVAALDGTFQRKVKPPHLINTHTHTHTTSVSAPTAIWIDSEFGSLSRKRGQAKGCVHAVFSGCCLHKETWIREAGMPS